MAALASPAKTGSSTRQGTQPRCLKCARPSLRSRHASISQIDPSCPPRKLLGSWAFRLRTRLRRHASEAASEYRCSASKGAEGGSRPRTWFASGWRHPWGVPSTQEQGRANHERIGESHLSLKRQRPRMAVRGLWKSCGLCFPRANRLSDLPTCQVCRPIQGGRHDQLCAERRRSGQRGA